MRNEKHRLAALLSLINPAGSLNAKLSTLTDEQRREYERWRDHLRSYHAAHPGGSAYERLLAGDQPCPLRRDVHAALFGTAPVIKGTMSVADAADAYQQFAKGN